MATGRKRVCHRGVEVQPLEPRMVLAAVSWDGGGGDNLWSNPLNWSGDFVPRAVDDVTIVVPNAQRFITGDAASMRVRSLTLDETLSVGGGNTLTVLEDFDLGQNADLRINGIANWAAGTWNTTRGARVNPGGVLNIGSGVSPDTGQVTLRGALENLGRIVWRGGEIALGAAGVLTNRPNKGLDIQSPGEMTGFGRLVNEGLLRRGGLETTTTLIGVGFETTDRIQVLRGTLQIGDGPTSPRAEMDGSIRPLGTNATVLFAGRATHADGVQYGGLGSLRFEESEQIFEGGARLGSGEVLFLGAGGGSEISVRFTGGGTILGGFEAEHAFIRVLAPTRLQGTFEFEDTVLTDTGLASRPLLSLAGSFIMDEVALAVDAVVAEGSTLEIGRTDGSSGAATVSGGYVLDNSGTITHHAGTLGIGVNASLRNEVTGLLVLTGPTVGGGPLSGPVINLGTLERRSSRSSNATTVITGGLDNQGTVDVVEGTLQVTGAITQLAGVPAAQNTTLSGGYWRVRNFATFDVAEPIELIARSATLDLQGLSNLPDLVGFLRENRGTMLLSGGRPGISGPGPAIVNKGTIRMDGNSFALQVFETPLDQRANGKIIVRNGTLQIHGLSGATRDFANPGLIRVEDGTLSLNLDEGAQTGTFINTGTLDIREMGRVTIDGAMSTSGLVKTELGNPFRGHISMSRALAIGGTLRATYVGQNYTNLFTSSIFIVGAFTVTGSFGTFTPINVPSGFDAMLNTLLGVSVRLVQ